MTEKINLQRLQHWSPGSYLKRRLGLAGLPTPGSLLRRPGSWASCAPARTRWQPQAGISPAVLPAHPPGPQCFKELRDSSCLSSIRGPELQQGPAWSLQAGRQPGGKAWVCRFPPSRAPAWEARKLRPMPSLSGVVRKSHVAPEALPGLRVILSPRGLPPAFGFGSSPVRRAKAKAAKPKGMFGKVPMQRWAESKRRPFVWG